MKQQLYTFLVLTVLVITLSTYVAAQSQVEEGAGDLFRTGVISGRVVSENGQPVESVAVFIQAWNSRGRQKGTDTDIDGRFQVAGLEPALYSVAVSAPGYISLAGEAGSQPSFYRIGDDATITLIKGGVITGTVTSASGEPLVMTGVRAILIQELDGQKSAVVQNERMTDDRGVYRLYGLQPGTYLISTGGRSSYRFYGNAYETAVPTYAPSSNRDTAVEISVRSGEEKSGVDIRYRADPGHVVSGTVDGPSAGTGDYSGTRVNLTQISNGMRSGGLSSSQNSSGRSFSIAGVGDGDYELTALTALDANELAVSEPRRITVKGADVTSIELITKPLGSISGHLALENSTVPECKGKRKPLLAETLVLIQNNSKEPARDDLRIIWYGRPLPFDKSGNVLFIHLAPGQYRFDLQFSAKYWYLKSMTQTPGPAITGIAKSAPVNRVNDGTRNWISLKQGERLNGLSFTLAEGAGSLRGSIKPAEGERIPSQLYLHLVPAEKDSAEDVLRYFATPVNTDGTFALGNLPPGRYWALARVSEGNAPKWVSKLRLPDESPTRLKLRREAETAKSEIEFKPCQNVTNYQLPVRLPIPVASASLQ